MTRNSILHARFFLWLFFRRSILARDADGVEAWDAAGHAAITAAPAEVALERADGDLVSNSLLRAAVGRLPAIEVRMP